MGRLKQHIGWLARGDAQTRAATDRIDRLQAEVDELRAQVARLDAQIHGSVTDLTERLGAMNERLERSGA